MRHVAHFKCLPKIALIVTVFSLLSCNIGKKENTSYSTIDTNIQQNIHKILENGIQQECYDWACVVIMETKTGEIKALVNLANYIDDSVSATITRVPDFASTRLIFPGHIFALASLMACVEDGYIDIQDIVIRENEMRIFDFTIKDNYNKETDTLSILDAFQLKSNTAVARIVFNNYKNNPEKFIQRINQFDLDKLLGLNWITEPSPIIATPGSENWTAASLPMLAIGYENKYTPLQLLSLYNAIVNNGKRIKPVIEKSDSLELPIVLNQSICSQKTLSAGSILLHSNQINSDSVQYPFFGHSAIVSDFSEHDHSRSYQMISIGFYPEINPKYACIVVCATKQLTYPNFAFGTMQDIFKILPINLKQ